MRTSRHRSARPTARRSSPGCTRHRSALITTTSGQGELKIHLPPGIRPIPELFQDAGYYTAITGWPNTDRATIGKTHYNFEWDEGHVRRSRLESPSTRGSRTDPSMVKLPPTTQPFFAQVHLPGGKHRGRSLESFRRISDRVEKLLGSRTDPSSMVKLPPYYPTNPTSTRMERSGPAGGLGGLPRLGAAHRQVRRRRHRTARRGGRPRGHGRPLHDRPRNQPCPREA